MYTHLYVSLCSYKRVQLAKLSCMHVYVSTPLLVMNTACAEHVNMKRVLLVELGVHVYMYAHTVVHE